MSYRSIWEDQGAAVKAAVRTLRQRVAPADAMDDTLARLEAGLRQSSAAVRRVQQSPQATQRFRQGRTVAGDRRIPAPPTLKNPPRPPEPPQLPPPDPRVLRQGAAMERSYQIIDRLALHDQEHGRGPWDAAALHAHPDYRRTRADMADFEDALHPEHPRFTSLGDTDVEKVQRRWYGWRGERPPWRMQVDPADIWAAEEDARRGR